MRGRQSRWRGATASQRLRSGRSSGGPGARARRSDSPAAKHSARRDAGRTLERRRRCPACWRAPTRRPFVGRARPCCASCEALAATRARGGRLVVLTGEPGIGKTRLAARFAAGVHADGRRRPLRARRRGERLALPAVRRGAAPLRGAPSRAGRGRAAPARGARGAGAARARARPVGRGRRRAASGGARRGTATSSFDGVVRLLLHAAAPAAAAARARGPALGRRARRCCCCASCCAAAPASRAARRSRPTASSRRAGRAAARARRPAARGARGHHPPRRAGPGRSRRRSSPLTAGGEPADDGVGAAAARPDRRQPVLHRGAAAQPAAPALEPARRRAPAASRT